MIITRKLVNEGYKLTMDRAIQIVQNHEYCQKQLDSMAINIPTNVGLRSRWTPVVRHQIQKTNEPGPKSKPFD